MTSGEQKEAAKRREELEYAFKFFDINNQNGKINAKEFGQYMKTVGLSPTTYEVEKMIELLDNDGDKNIDKEEFISYVLNHEDVFDMRESLKHEIAFALHLFGNDIGRIVPEELIDSISMFQDLTVEENETLNSLILENTREDKNLVDASELADSLLCIIDDLMDYGEHYTLTSSTSSTTSSEVSIGRTSEDSSETSDTYSSASVSSGSLFEMGNLSTGES
eukprot:TRINITY_DN2222_c0_g2_i2.p1 TRINITY_DN2222_c0_g2~~TRINITY_DN2222_c0_g2_i2.p1  ORF type:complete len:221 (+),score=67.95 TRINITY_DN2222_c0_g2_i2:478-1140(+)